MGVTPQNTRSQTVRLTKARTSLLLEHPFFGALLFRLKLQESHGVQMMATNGVSLYYNPAGVAELSTAQLVGVLAHEVLHPALQHHTRRGDRNPKVWNMACDYAINPLLVDAGLTLPSGVLLDDRFRGMSAERIYQLLAQETDSGSAGSSDSSGAETPTTNSESSDTNDSGQDQDREAPVTAGGFGQVLDAPNPEQPGAPATPDQLREQEREWRVALQQAQTSAKMAGKCPLGIDRAMEEAERASIDWKEALRRCYSETLAIDYTWSRPNRRFIGSGLYLPGIRKEGVGELAIAVDCSGSISNRTLSLFSAEISSLIEENHPERVHVLYFDAAVQKTEVYEFGQPVLLTPKGGGGTDFAPVFDYLAEQHITPHSVVFLTDLCGRFPEEEPPFPVIWASTDDREAPFGSVVYMGAA